MGKKFAALLLTILTLTSFSLYAYAFSDMDNSIPDGTTATSVRVGYDLSAGESIEFEEIYPE